MHFGLGSGPVCGGKGRVNDIFVMEKLGLSISTGYRQKMEYCDLCLYKLYSLRIITLEQYLDLGGAWGQMRIGGV
jgi:hypothetical protein